MWVSRWARGRRRGGVGGGGGACAAAQKTVETFQMTYEVWDRAAARAVRAGVVVCACAAVSTAPGLVLRARAREKEEEEEEEVPPKLLSPNAE